MDKDNSGDKGCNKENSGDEGMNSVDYHENGNKKVPDVSPVDAEPMKQIAQSDLSPLDAAPSRQIAHSDSGIVVSPLSPANNGSLPQSPALLTPEDNNEAGEDGKEVVESPAQAVAVDPASSSRTRPSPRKSDCHHQKGSLTTPRLSSPRKERQKSKSPRPHLHHSKSKASPDSFAYETKYVVLQFLQQATNEQNICLSQTSLSTPSESDSQWKGHSRTQRLRASWQHNRSSSLPTSPRRHTSPLAKTKGNRSSPDLKDVNFFQNVSPVQSKGKMPLIRPFRKTKSSPKKQSSLSDSTLKTSEYVRSVSNYTENSEAGTYNSDADDELDTSFESSQQGSVTSHSLRNKLAYIHAERLPTVPSEAESLAEPEYPQTASVSESVITHESLGFAVNDALSAQDDALSLDMIHLDDANMAPVDAFNRVHHYLAQMGDSSQEPVPCGLFDQLVGLDSTPDTTLQGGYDEVDSPPFDKTVMPDSSMLDTRDLEPSEEGDGIAAHGTGFYQSSSNGSDSQVFETEEGACGGETAGDGDTHIINGNNTCGRLTADRSNLRLDLQSPDDPSVLCDAVLSLQQELEEEISSFESEYEEALLNICSDGSLSVNPGRSHSFSPETTEIAQILMRIGDDVQERYFQQFERAVGQLLIANCAGLFTYDNFRNAALVVLDGNLNSWHQVATLLLYSQHVALHLAQTGRRSVHCIVDYTVKLLADKAADFILKQGGWAAISAINQSSSSSPEEIGPTLGPRFDLAHSTHEDTVNSTGVDPPEGWIPPPMPDQSRGESDQSPAAAQQLLSVSFQSPEDTKQSPAASQESPDVSEQSPAMLNQQVATSPAVAELPPSVPQQSFPVQQSASSHSSMEEMGEAVDGAGRETTTNSGAVNGGVDAPGTTEGSGDVLSTVQNMVVNSNLATRCAVSVGILAVGAALVLSFVRS